MTIRHGDRLRNSLYWCLFPAAIVIPADFSYAVQYLSVEQAQKIMFPAAQIFLDSEVDLSLADIDLIKQNSGVSSLIKKQPVWTAFDAQGKLQGYVLLDNVIGKHELITYALALTDTGVIKQVEILDYREVRGAEIIDPSWREKFVNKKQGDSLTVNKDIPNISGATLSCIHVTEGVRRLLALYSLKLVSKAHPKG